VVPMLASALLVTACAGHPSAAASRRTPTPATTPTPSAATARPLGPPAAIAWWWTGRLHLPDGRTIRTPLHVVAERGGTTLVGRSDEGGSRWRLVRGHRLVTLVRAAQPVEPVLSSDGRHLAWTTERTLRTLDRYRSVAAFTTTAYDVTSGRQIGTTVRSSRVQCCDAGGVVGVLTVDNDGTVVLQRDYRQLWAWRPGHAPVALHGPVARFAAAPDDQWPGGVTWFRTGDGAGPAASARVTRSGEVVRVGAPGQAILGLWSPDGASYAFRPFVEAERLPWVVWSGGRQVRLRVPRRAQLVAWESAGSVVLRVGRRPTTLIRCDGGTGACEQAGRPLAHAVLPAYAG
jgi:hypothetical protein